MASVTGSGERADGRHVVDLKNMVRVWNRALTVFYSTAKGISAVEVLDRYFGNVCELDLIFNFHKAYHILDELLITGELQEPSKKAILRVTAAQDALMEGSGDSKVSDSKYEI